MENFETLISNSQLYTGSIPQFPAIQCKGGCIVFCPDKNFYLICYCDDSKMDAWTLCADTFNWMLQVCTGEVPPSTLEFAYWFEGSNLFINGGICGEVSNSSTFFLNIDTWIWKKAFTMDLPSARHLHCAIKVPNKEEAYIYGGWGAKQGKCISELCKFDYSKSYAYNVHKNTYNITLTLQIRSVDQLG